MGNTAEKENWVSIQGLYEMAYRAHTGTSFSPEKRATDVVKCYERELNDDLQRMPENERQRYLDGYKKHLFAWLSAKSNCISTMIAGPANFPVRRATKANLAERKRSDEFTEWRNKAFQSINKRIEADKPQSIKDDEMFSKIKKEIDRCFEWNLSVTLLKGRIETVAKTGNVELIKKTLDYLENQQISRNKVIATKRNSIWQLADVAHKYSDKIESMRTADSNESTINGVRVVNNIQADRIQLFFDGKPAPEIIGKLKKNAFKWSPSQYCWQRQLTQNAIYATKNILA